MEPEPGQLKTIFKIRLMMKRMLWVGSKYTFDGIPYPVKDTIEDYKEATGMQDKKQIEKADLVWGSNKMHIPMPKFLDLYQEHVVAPFFVF
jgi:cation-transporting ATPase 13A1